MKRATLLVLSLFVAVPAIAATVTVVFGNMVTTTVTIVCPELQSSLICDVMIDKLRIPDATGIANGVPSQHTNTSAHVTRANLATCAALLDP